MIASSPIIETQRLRLRAPIEEDFEALASFYASDRASFVGGPLTRADSWRLFATIIGHWVLRGYGLFTVTDKNTGAIYGRVGPWFPEGWPEPELGWTLQSEAEGKGIGFEAAQAARDYAYTTLGWMTSISLIDQNNHRSVALAEKLGAHYEYTLENHKLGPVFVYRHPSPEELV